MTRAIVTFGVGIEHEQMLEVALPTFREFAGRHGYQILADPLRCEDRPASWGKIPALMDALASHEAALWLDADTLIVDPSQDIPCPHGAVQALVEHLTQDGRVPNLGVWYVRQAMLPILARLWAMTEYVNHGWWEQAAMMYTLGYTLTRPTRLDKPTRLYRRTAFLDSGWNVHPWNRREPADHARILHATMYPDRVGTMRNWADHYQGVPT